MNESALLTIRAELGVLDDDVRARLRAGVLDLVGLDADGVATIRPATTTSITGIVREPVLIDTVGEDGDVIDLTDRTLERRRTARTTPSRSRALLAAAAVVVALLVVGSGLSRQRTTPDAQIIATLSTATNGDELITALGQAPDTPLPNGAYDYERIETATPAETAPQEAVRTVEKWVDNNSTGRTVDSGKAILASAAPGAPTLVAATDGFDSAAPKAGSLRLGAYTFAEVRGLPTDPTALRAELFRLAHIDPSRTADLYDRVAELLTLHSTPPLVRVALARILLGDGATVLGQVADRNGRRGLGIAVSLPDGSRRIFVLDVNSYHRLGDFTVPAGAAPTADQASAWNTVLDNRIVDSTSAR